MGKAKRTAAVARECVACGCCEKSCPLGAVRVVRGLRAAVEEHRCAGCGRCEAACPAQVISLREAGI